ncbi:ABC transporter ATP-binding protein [Aliiglaciecola sp. 3_MG-2023]|uniref:ABC transporter ATP-binding protein n=1 Tax=Aliiglaciecola sp. 3_MG-2023 TaxID=3062644 RepID=UPI0026E19264|nr:ABC transporter ATP-binding protein [Aliiglaciecola sp. 3_MG-2023]MDO6693785.1 ABC transporter ATP-binding protein [Aliiglaciecola sp. 3_MG-2023]
MTTQRWSIEFDNVTFGYPSPRPSNLGEAQGLTIDIKKWQVEENQTVFISGQSGSGKSTLLNLICGTLQPSSGSISILGQAFSALSESKRDRFRAEHIGVVFQQFNLIPYLSVKQNIELAAYFGKGLKVATTETIINICQQLNLPSTLLQAPASQLSVGQQQRVAIARALINQPELLIVDEPTSALDSSARDSFMQLLMDSAKRYQFTLLFVSHDLSLADYFEQHIKLADINQAGEISE